MTPNQLQDNAAALLDLYARAEEEMLRKVARRLARGIDENGWAERKYGEIRQLQVEIRRSLEHLARQSSELRNVLVENAFETGEAAFRDEYRALGGFLRAVPESRFNAVATLTNELSERFEAAHSAILRDVDDNYRRIIGAAVSMQATGTITTRDAVKSALNSFAEKGIIGFVDKAGRHWNMDSYAEMAVRTGLMRAMREGYRQDALAHGEELVIISEHEDTCPLCVDWERAVLALTDAGAQHPEADGTLAEAEAAGLFHPNCGHSMTVYVPGLTDKSSRKRETLGYSRAEDMVGYENRQQQRYMERQVRAWKRRQAVATTPEDERYAKAYVDKWQRALRAYTGETKLPRKITREGGRVKLSEAARKQPSLTILPSGRIIQSRVRKWSEHKPPNPLMAPYAAYLDDSDKGTWKLYVYDSEGRINIRLDRGHHGNPKLHEFYDTHGNETYNHFHSAKWDGLKFKGFSSGSSLTEALEEDFAEFLKGGTS